MGFLLYKLNSSLISILAHFVHYLHCAFHCALSFSFMLCSCVIHQGSKALSCEKLRAAYQLKHSSYNSRTTTTREAARKQTNKQAARQKETNEAPLVSLLDNIAGFQDEAAARQPKSAACREKSVVIYS